MAIREGPGPEAEVEEGEDGEGISSQEADGVDLPTTGVVSSQEARALDSQEPDLLASQGELGS